MKEIIEITPFQDLWYVDCFYMSLLPILKKVGAMESFLTRFVYVYDVLEDGMLTMKQITPNQSVYEMLRDYGIQCQPVMKCDDVIHEMEQSIKHKKLMIVPIDAYYEKNRRDTYHRNSLGHSLLVNGYDDEEKVAYIIEHSVQTEVDFIQRELEYPSLVESHDGFLAKIHELKKNLPDFCYVKEKFPSLFLFEIVKNTYTNQEYDLNTYRQEMRSNLEQLEESLQWIPTFSKRLEQLLIQGGDDIKFGNYIIDRINKIYLYRSAELYTNQIIWNEKEIIDQAKTMLNQWRLIRSVVTRCVYRKRDREANYKECQNMLQIVYEQEMNYINIVRNMEFHI